MTESSEPRTDASAQPPADMGGDEASLLPEPPRRRRSLAFALTPTRALLINAFLMALLAGGVFGLFSWRRAAATAQPAPPTTPEAIGQESAPQAPQPGPPAGPDLWLLADQAYKSADYPSAQGHYRRLLEQSEAAPTPPAVADFLRWRLARCLVRAGKAGEAAKLLATPAESDSPALRAAANHDLAVLKCLTGDHLSARVRAYTAMAVADAKGASGELALSCRYVAARALTDKVLADRQTSLGLAFQHGWEDGEAFPGLDPAAVRKHIVGPAPQPDAPAAAATVTPAASEEDVARYAIDCRRSPLEVLLARLAGASRTEVRWDSVDPAARRREVTVLLKAASAPDVFEIACGSAGLVARFADGSVVVSNPQSCPTLSRQHELLYQEAVSAWRRLLLRRPDELRASQGHLAIAALHACSGEEPEALKQYQFVAGRFPRQPAARSALLKAANLRIRLRDHAGARANLMDLLNLQPDCESLEEVYLTLGRASASAGLHAEARDTFRKVYFLDLSSASRREACLGAARSSHALGDHKETCLWLNRCFKPGQTPPGAETASAHLMMGLSLMAMKAYPDAVKALRQCVRAAEPDDEQRATALLALARAHKELSAFSAAIAALGEIDPASLKPSVHCEYLMVTSGVHRAMGLPGRAARMLRSEIATAGGTEMALTLRLELAECWAEDGQLAAARGVLEEVVGQVPAGPVGARAAARLAEICLEEGKPARAIAIGRELLKSDAPDVRGAVLKVLAEAYARQGDHQRSALALAGLLPDESKGAGQ